MAENPLLPNAKLRELYALTERVQGLIGGVTGKSRLEAILAATFLQVEPGDFVSSPPAMPAAATLAADRTSSAREPKANQLRDAGSAPPPSLRWATVAGIAQGLALGRQERFALLYVDGGSAGGRNEPGWPEALRYAVDARLPLIVAVADVQGTTAPQGPADALSWGTMSPLAHKIHLPVLSVDGTDAVAVYRAMQESVLRVRHGDGPVVLWCLLPRRGRMDGLASTPLSKLRAYLQARKIMLPTRNIGKPSRAGSPRSIA